MGFPPSPDPSPDLWPVAEAPIHTKLTPPTPDRPDRRRKRDTFVPPPPSDNDEILFDEPAPFAINNGPNLARSSLDEYEHWYRGEGRGGGGRNGGRGEIRIATRTEMLEIASFGHPPSRSNSNHGHGLGDLGFRNKAYDDSTVGTRYMWVDENAENVLDEAPLTDLDDVDTDSMFHPGSQEAYTYESHHARTDSQPTQEDARSVEPDPEPDGPSDPVTPARPPPSRAHSRAPSRTPSRIARATSPSVGPGTSTTSLVSRPGRSPTPSKARSPPPKAQSSKAKSPARRGTAASAASKSPAAGTSQRSPPSGSTPKSPRVGATTPNKNNTPSPRSTPKRTKKVSTSTPGPHPLADAIPLISQDQPPDDGNWDDVVLPTVARRMQGGEVVTMLERKPREEEKEEPIPPAPGTFGFLERQREREAAKERERKRGSGTEMEEFGAWDGMAKKPKVEKQEERNKAPSPPPFSDYTPAPPKPVSPPPEPVRRPSPRPAPTPSNGMVITEADLRRSMQDKHKSDKDDSHGGGCCKCVVM